MCVNKSGASHEVIAASGRFCANVLNEDQEHTGRQFAGLSGRDVDRFGVGDWTVLSTGSPVLAGALAAFDCTTVDAIEQGTHTIFVGAVVGVKSGVQEPLLYLGRRFRQLRKSFASSESDLSETLHF